jgi:hypothetical protein
MFPSTGSETLDVILQVALALAVVTSIVLLIRNYRDR